MASFRPTDLRRSPPSRRTSAGISPALPSASAQACVSPMWSRLTLAPAGRSTAPCARSRSWPRRVAAAVATRWIEDGDRRHDPALHPRRDDGAPADRGDDLLEPGSYLSDPLSFNLWLPLRNGWTRSAFVSHVRSTGLGVVASDAFTAEGAPPEAVRVGLGGPVTRSQIERGLEFMAHALAQEPVAIAT